MATGSIPSDPAAVSNEARNVFAAGRAVGIEHERRTFDAGRDLLQQTEPLAARGFGSILSPHFEIRHDHLNSVPSIHIRCRMTASLRATATFALRNPLRFASLTPQALSADHFATRVSSTLAAS
jgi:hypothetical protein